MALRIRPYTEEWCGAVAAFNSRLAAGGVAPELRFPESHIPAWLPPDEGRRIYQEQFLAADGEFVRGGYILKHQEFSFRGRLQPVAFYRLPLSEGIVDKAYTSVGVSTLRHALRSHPVMFALGMGGFDLPLPRMLKAMGWSLRAVPFFFRVCRPARFLRQIRPLRSTRARAALLDAAAATGAGWLAIRTVQAMRASTAAPVEWEICERFGPWADEIWRGSHPRYAMAGARDNAVLDLLYPPDDPRFIRVRVMRGGATAGWAVVLNTAMRGDRYFGDMRVGSLIDCMAAPENAGAVVAAATRVLEKGGVDLIVSNQAHAALGNALRRAGFLSGPSNFILAASPALTALLEPGDGGPGGVHVTRGDGDGPIHL